MFDVLSVDASETLYNLCDVLQALSLNKVCSFCRWRVICLEKFAFEVCAMNGLASSGQWGCVFLLGCRTQWPLCASQVSVCKRVEMSALTGIWTGNGS